MDSRFVKLAFLIVAGLIVSQIDGKPEGKNLKNAGENVTLEELQAATVNASVLIIDVRQPSELSETGVIPNSINIPLNLLKDTLTLLSEELFLEIHQRPKPKLDSVIIFTCRSGNRSRQAQDIALNLGYVNAKNFPGGWLEWEQHEAEIKTSSGASTAKLF